MLPETIIIMQKAQVQEWHTKPLLTEVLWELQINYEEYKDQLAGVVRIIETIV